MRTYSVTLYEIVEQSEELTIIHKTKRKRRTKPVPKDTYIRIRLTAEQKRQIKEAAKQSKTNMSDFVLTATRNNISKGDK